MDAAGEDAAIEVALDLLYAIPDHRSLLEDPELELWVNEIPG